jgi:2-dehydro-3-deoxygluconokinase
MLKDSSLKLAAEGRGGRILKQGKLAEVSHQAVGGLARLGANATTVCVGETMILLAPRRPAPLSYGQEFVLSIGGAESNVAMYLADHGLKARWVSRLGDDSLGHIVLDHVASAGVDVSAVELDSTRPTGVYLKEPEASGTRIHYYRQGSAAGTLGPAVLNHPQVRSADLLHLSGVTPALSDSCRALVEAALLEVQIGGPVVSFDVNWRPSLWLTDPAELLLRLARAAEIVFVGADEATGLWDCTDHRSVRQLIPEPQILVVKDAGRGATAFIGEDSVFVPALDIEVTEAVGAGDAFAAGFLAGMLRGLDAIGQVRLGHMTAAAALRVSDDHGPLLPAKLQRRLLTGTDEDWACAKISAAVSPLLDHTLLVGD